MASVPEILTPEQVEHFAKLVALGNNGGDWAMHYLEPHKEHWREYVRVLAYTIATALAEKAADQK